MEPLVDIVIEDDRWEAFGLEALAEPAVRASFAELGLADVGFTICLMGCDDARILELNGDFRGKAKPTNVLSWPSEERGADAGQVPDLPQPGA
ncbi:MAG: rRNA maturation RNAse YbeY, partial [Cypionkella sp.]